MEGELQLEVPLQVARGAHRGALHEEARGAVALAAGLEALQIAHDGRGIVAIVEARVRGRAAGSGGELLVRPRVAPRGAQRLDAIGADLDAGGGLVAAEADELGAAAREAVVQARAGRAAHRPAAALALEADDDRGLAEARGDPAGHDAHDAGVPALPREQDRGLAIEAGALYLGERRGQHLVLDRAARHLRLLDRGRERRGGDAALLEQERERDVGITEPPGRVEARGDAEGDVLGRGAAREVEVREPGERAEAGAPARLEDGEARADERAVVARERRDVGDGADRDEVEERPEVERRAEPLAHRGADREREPA